MSRGGDDRRGVIVSDHAVPVRRPAYLPGTDPHGTAPGSAPFTSFRRLWWDQRVLVPRPTNVSGKCPGQRDGRRDAGVTHTIRVTYSPSEGAARHAYRQARSRRPRTWTAPRPRAAPHAAPGGDGC